ncbi:MAG: hypothetical protein LHW41_08215 [Candidatus Cloacimonetes bacterium]|nr:hypothetical protein [Candidatus Cloacimonadota bacterium]MDD3562732.1 hypothetical protein [Candidatus Cloacimonadota bacterium]
MPIAWQVTGEDRQNAALSPELSGGGHLIPGVYLRIVMILISEAFTSNQWI